MQIRYEIGKVREVRRSTLDGQAERPPTSSPRHAALTDEQPVPSQAVLTEQTPLLS